MNFDSLSSHDANLMRQFIVGLLTYEDAIRQAESRDSLRLAMKLHLMPGWLAESGEGSGDDPEAEPSSPQTPPKPTQPGAAEKEPSDT